MQQWDLMVTQLLHDKIIIVFFISKGKVVTIILNNKKIDTNVELTFIKSNLQTNPSNINQSPPIFTIIFKTNTA